MSFFERYCDGEYQQVWQELRTVDNIRSIPAIYEDAIAVVQETMKRVRLNIEMLIPRLLNLGFCFGYDWFTQPKTWSLLSYIDEWNWVKDQPPIFLPADLCELRLAQLDKTFQKLPLVPAYLQQQKEQILHQAQMKNYVETLEVLFGDIPLSIRGWYEKVGSVNFIGYYAPWALLYENEGKSYLENYDPIFIKPLDRGYLDELRAYKEKWPVASYIFEIAPDRWMKHHISGGGSLNIRIPMQIVDPIIESEHYPMPFVNYIRLALQWAGFPGLQNLQQPPLDDIEALTRDFLPF